MAARQGWGLKNKYNSQSSPRLDQEMYDFDNKDTGSVREFDRNHVDVRNNAFFRKKKDLMSQLEEEYIEKEKVKQKGKKKEKRKRRTDFENVKVYLRIRPPTTEFTFINKISKNKQSIDITKDFELLVIQGEFLRCNGLLWLVFHERSHLRLCPEILWLLL